MALIATRILSISRNGLVENIDSGSASGELEHNLTIQWRSLEHLSALALGCVGLAMGDPGVTAAGAVGGAALIGAWRDTRAAKGIESANFVAGVRKKVRRGFDAWAQGRPSDQSELSAADEAMARHLPDCLPERAALATLMTNQESYPRHVGRLVVDCLAEHDPLFSEDSGQGGSRTARQFALSAVEASLRLALEDHSYTQILLPHMLAAIGTRIGHLEERANALLKEMSAIGGQVTAVINQVPDLALRREIMNLVRSSPDASVAEIAGDVARFAREYDDLLKEIAKVKAEDNAIRGAEQAAEQALKDGDLGKARQLLGEAVSSARERVKAPLRDLSRVLYRQGSVSLLQRDWRAAKDAWSSAIVVLKPVDPKTAEAIAINTATSLSAHGAAYGQTGAVDAAITFYRELIADAAEHGETKLQIALLNGLGIAFSTLVERAHGAVGESLFNEARQAYDQALEICDEHKYPELRVTVLNNLGAALGARAERIDGPAKVTTFIAAGQALSELIKTARGRFPEDVAMAEMNLASVNSRLAELVPAELAPAFRRSALRSFRKTLGYYSKEENPEYWAAANMNIGQALRLVAELEPEEKALRLLNEAIKASERAALVYNRDKSLSDWAAINHNMACALVDKSELLTGMRRIAALEEAHVLLKKALDVFRPADFAYHRHISSQLLESVKKRLDGLRGNEGE